VHEDESSPHKPVRIVRKVEDEAFVVESFAFVVDLDFETRSLSRNTNRDDPGGIHFVPMHYRVHEKLTHNEKKPVEIPEALAARELRHTLQDGRH
jgi:hypothetical protein